VRIPTALIVTQTSSALYLWSETNYQTQTKSTNTGLDGDKNSPESSAIEDKMQKIKRTSTDLLLISHSSSRGGGSRFIVPKFAITSKRKVT
jgi:hypothetical protein